MRDFCAYFDWRFLPRGLALYRSLQRHSGPFRLWVLCLDEKTHRVLEKFESEGLRAVRLRELEEADTELLRVRPERSAMEYYMTLTPAWPLWLLRTHPEIAAVTFLDADLYFFSDPEPLFKELGNRSVAIIEHRFAPDLKDWERTLGRYNVAWVTFRKDKSALACLRWWRERCLEWCHNRAEDGRFTDQKYLDDWTSRFRNVAVLRHKGADLAPWNLANYDIRREGGRVWVDTDPLIFYHFSGFKQVVGGLFDLNLTSFGVEPSRALRYGIYAPYIRELRQALSELRLLLPQTTLRTGGRANPSHPLLHEFQIMKDRLPSWPYALALGPRLVL